MIAYQASRIVAFTPLARKRVPPATGSPGDASFRLAISNILMENDRHELWRSVIAEADPDIVVALEVDDKWMAALAPLRRTHPHVAERVQDNYYGMAVFSRLPLEETEVRYLVDAETPSIRTNVRLRNGRKVRLLRAAPEAAGAAAQPGLRGRGTPSSSSSPRRSRPRSPRPPWSAETSTTSPGRIRPAPSSA